MEKIIAMLKELKPDVDYLTETRLVTDKILDSIDITALIAMLEEEFGIEIGMESMENANFDSARAIWDMVQDLQD
ncbi:MAG: acyl carrier protein [Lachnospiraceae bacterium]|nr:acyl carrier protein [Lachnospiraceae bacterium]